MHGAARQYREEGNFSTWLYRIALNVARDAARRRQWKTVSMNGRDVITTDANAANLCERQEAATLVRAALAALPDPLREVLILRHYEDLNFEQIARLTGTPASTLKSRFGVALRQLRQILQEHGLEPEEMHP